jgi:hypothetical protein
MSLSSPNNMIWAQDIYFIFDGVADSPFSYQANYETRLYRFGEKPPRLEQVWTLGEYKQSAKFGVYPSADCAVIAGAGVNPRELYIFSMENVENPTIFTLDEGSTAGRYYYYQVADKSDLIEIKYIEVLSGVKLAKSGLLSVDERGASLKAKDPDLPGELRLYGCSPVGTAHDDIVTFSKLPIGDKAQSLKSFGIEIAPVPEDIIQLGSSRGWVMIANEPQFYALISIPDRNGLMHRELLIYDRANRKWDSILLEGAETAPTLVNGWLIAQILDVNPETDVEIRKSFPGKYRPETIMINPVEKRQLTVRLGGGGRILLIEGDTVYFKVVSKLYKGRIAGNDIVDKELLIDDPSVIHFAWGFRGSTSDEDISPDEVPEDKKAGD